MATGEPPGDLWPLCLAIVQRRRHGVQAAAVPAGVTLDAANGYALQGPWDDAARALFAQLKPLLDAGERAQGWVVGQLGQSLDGCIATHSGDACFVNGPEGLVHVHRLRALCDAVLVGAGTATLDNPQLTTRRVPGPNATRVLLDPSLRVPASARVFNDGLAPTLLVCGTERRAEAEARLGAARVVAVPWHAGRGGMLALPAVVDALRARGLQRLFVEGGGITVSEFVRQGCLDRLHLIVAPVVIGGGRRGLTVPPADRMSEALRPPARSFALGTDILWDLDLRA